MNLLIACLSLLFFPIKTIKMVRQELDSFLFGEPEKQYSSPTVINVSVTDPFRFFYMDFQAKRIEHMQYSHYLKEVWRRSSPQERKELKPLIEKFAAQCNKFNQIAPRNLALKLEDLM